MMRSALVAAIVLASRIASSDTGAAAQLYRLGQHAYEAKDYDEAIRNWTSSFELSGARALLFNLGQAYRLRGHDGDCATALQHYQRFVETPTSSQRAEQRRLAEGYIRDLGTCSSTPPRPPEPDSPRPTAERGGRFERPLGIAVGAAGVAALATGIYFGHRASTLGDDVSRACAVSCDWSTEKSVDSSGRRDATLGRVLDGVGVAAAIGGAALFYLGMHDDEVAMAPLATSRGERGVAVSWRLRW